MTWELEYQMILCWALGIAATEHARLALVRSGSTTEPWAASPKVRCPRTEARRLARMQRPQRGISARIRRLARVTAKGREPSSEPGTKRHVWTTPSKQGRFGMLRRGRVRSCVRPTLRGLRTAGPDAIRSLAPKQIYVY